MVRRAESFLHRDGTEWHWPTEDEALLSPFWNVAIFALSFTPCGAIRVNLFARQRARTSRVGGTARSHESGHKHGLGLFASRHFRLVLLIFFTAGSPWPEEEAAVARSCPWAKQPDVVAALESTGGRGEDAIELLIAARNEPGLEGESGEADGKGAEGQGAGESKVNGGGAPALDSAPQGSRTPDGTAGEGGENGEKAGPAKGNGKKSAKAAKKVPRSADCPCGSGQKYKKCCKKKDAAIARGQVAPPAEPEGASEDSSLVDDLGSLVI